jgi:hypothetical protein
VGTRPAGLGPSGGVAARGSWPQTAMASASPIRARRTRRDHRYGGFAVKPRRSVPYIVDRIERWRVDGSFGRLTAGGFRSDSDAPGSHEGIPFTNPSTSWARAARRGGASRDRAYSAGTCERTPDAAAWRRLRKAVDSPARCAAHLFRTPATLYPVFVDGVGSALLDCPRNRDFRARRGEKLTPMRVHKKVRLQAGAARAALPPAPADGRRRGGRSAAASPVRRITSTRPVWTSIPPIWRAARFTLRAGCAPVAASRRSARSRISVAAIPRFGIRGHPHGRPWRGNWTVGRERELRRSRRGCARTPAAPGWWSSRGMRASARPDGRWCARPTFLRVGCCRDAPEQTGAPSYWPRARARGARRRRLWRTRRDELGADAPVLAHLVPGIRCVSSSPPRLPVATPGAVPAAGRGGEFHPSRRSARQPLLVPEICTGRTRCRPRAPRSPSPRAACRSRSSSRPAANARRNGSRAALRCDAARAACRCAVRSRCRGRAQ